MYTLLFILAAIFIIITIFYFYVYKNPVKENFSFSDFMDDIGTGFEDAGKYIAGSYIALGEEFENFGILITPYLRKALEEVGVYGQQASDNMAQEDMESAGYDAADTVTSFFTEVVYEADLVVEDVADAADDDLLGGFGLIESSLTKYIDPPYISPSSGIPGYENYLQSTALNLTGVLSAEP